MGRWSYFFVGLGDCWEKWNSWAFTRRVCRPSLCFSSWHFDCASSAWPAAILTEKWRRPVAEYVEPKEFLKRFLFFEKIKTRRQFEMCRLAWNLKMAQETRVETKFSEEKPRRTSVRVFETKNVRIEESWQHKDGCVLVQLKEKTKKKKGRDSRTRQSSRVRRCRSRSLGQVTRHHRSACWLAGRWASGRSLATARLPASEAAQQHAAAGVCTARSFLRRTTTSTRRLLFTNVRPCSTLVPKMADLEIYIPTSKKKKKKSPEPRTWNALLDLNLCK